jgi:hypothetical protein
VKFLPLSLQIIFGQPRLEINLNACMNTSAFNELASSIWIARLLKQTKIHPYTFSVEHPLLTGKGSKKSIPVYSR